MDRQELISFLYLLARDRLPVGAIEQLVLDSNKAPGTVNYSNKLLAAQAEEWADRLTGKF